MGSSAGVVTILFTDLVASTELLARVDDLRVLKRLAEPVPAT